MSGTRYKETIKKFINLRRTEKAKWRVKCVLVPGQKGTAKAYAEHGDDLVCVRYRYYEKGFRIKTVEIVVDKKKVR